LDIDCLEIIKSGEYQLPELIERQCVRGIWIGQKIIILSATSEFYPVLTAPAKI
jgi:hypothetical protein